MNKDGVELSFQVIAILILIVIVLVIFIFGVATYFLWETRCPFCKRSFLKKEKGKTKK